MIYIALAIIYTSIWRYCDGSDKRWPKSNLFILLPLLAGTVLFLWPFELTDLPILVPLIVTGYLMVRGMPGWTEWNKMLLGFGLPTAGAAVVFTITNDISVEVIMYAVSGSGVAATYVVLSKIGDLKWLTAEIWGRLSYGLIVGSYVGLLIS
tara:strand:- start:103 stop:558 length:456 start_codon:yes stop_codon:yes gene_type:complete